MSAGGPTSSRPKPRKKAAPRKPPPRWRKYLVQADLELPEPPPAPPTPRTFTTADGTEVFIPEPPPLPWWQQPRVIAALAILCVALVVTTIWAVRRAAHDREAALVAQGRERVLTLRAYSETRALRIAPNPRSWSSQPDAAIRWPEPPQWLELQFPVGYVSHVHFAVVVDKVDHGRVLMVERMAADSNRDLRLAVNSTAFGPGEYRIRLQGYTWRGERIDVGWVRLRVDAP